MKQANNSETSVCPVKKISEERTFAGFKAHGYQSSCKDQGGGMTLWMADDNSKIRDISKKMQEFEKAHLEAKFSKYPKAQRDATIQMMTLMGTAMAQVIAGNGFEVKLWNHAGDLEPLEQIKAGREMKGFPPMLMGQSKADVQI